MNLHGESIKFLLKAVDKVGRVDPVKKYLDPNYKDRMRMLKDEAENTSKKYWPKKMKDGGMTCRGKGAAIKGANYKG